jgi:hypothetical protein
MVVNLEFTLFTSVFSLKIEISVDIACNIVHWREITTKEYIAMSPGSFRKEISKSSDRNKSEGPPLSGQGRPLHLCLPWTRGQSCREKRTPGRGHHLYKSSGPKHSLSFSGRKRNGSGVEVTELKGRRGWKIAVSGT